jgi:SAM-dependent methyltransferase
MRQISDRLARAVEALPLTPGMRVLEIGCGPGVAARAVAARIGSGKVLAIDRSQTAIDQAVRGSAAEIAAGRLEFRCAAIEDFVPAEGEAPFDLAYAHRVGALDGRHPAAGKRALARLKQVLKPGALLVIDDRPPIRAEDLDV